MSLLRSIDQNTTAEAPSRGARDRLSGIDGLRALAIVAILAGEIVRLAPALVARNAAAGAAAFDASQGFTLFLIVSGYTLAYPALVARSQNGHASFDVGGFIVKRLLRIFPTYLFALALALVIPPLAAHYGLAVLATGSQRYAAEAFWRNAVFAGDGLGNDGFRALGIIARCYAVFPFLLVLWARARGLFPVMLALVVVLDLTTGLHGLGIGALLPFALGIVAAEVRAQALPAYRFGLPLALIAGAAALRYGEGIASIADAHAAGALRVDPLWAIALFGVVVAVGALDPLGRILSLPPLGLAGAASFAISLVVVPVSSFAIRQLAAPFGIVDAAVNGLVGSLLIGLGLYQLVDRAFSGGPLRHDIAEKLGPRLNALLARVHAQRVLLGTSPVADAGAASAHPPTDVTVYTPAPRPDISSLAIVSTRTGSAEELAAEIQATRRRLTAVGP